MTKEPLDLGTVVRLGAASATIRLSRFTVADLVVLDEILLESTGPTVRLKGQAVEAASAGAAKFTASLSEASINALIEALYPADGPIRNLKATVYTGHVLLKGQYVKSIMSLPFSLDARPVVEDGVRLRFECGSSQVGGVGLPAPVLEVLQKALNEKLTIDLTQLETPLTVEAVRCEPARLAMTGKADLVWPIPVGARTALHSKNDPERL